MKVCEEAGDLDISDVREIRLCEQERYPYNENPFQVTQLRDCKTGFMVNGGLRSIQVYI